MKTPTLEEVKEHFKNAKEIKFINTEPYEIDTEKYDVFFDGENYRQGTNDKEQRLLLWDMTEGYTEIISYKEQKETQSKPNHYPQGYDVIDFVKDNELNFNEGNVIKYVVRARKKGNHIEDLKKAKDYLEREIKYYENNRPTNPNS